MKASAKKVGVVVAREYLFRVRKKSFLISTLAFPFIMLLGVSLPILIGARGASGGGQIVLVDRTGILAPELVERIQEGGLRVETVVPDSPEMETAFARAEEGEITGILEVDSTTLTVGSARWTGEEGPSTLRAMSLRQAVVQSALTIRLGEVVDAGEVEGIRSLLEGGDLEVVTFEQDSLSTFERLAGYGAGFVGAYLLFITLISHGAMMTRSVLEEKTGRIAEVVLSSLHPRELMLGKIVGVGAVALTQLAVWVGSMALVASLGLPMLLALLPPEMAVDTDLPELIRAATPALGVLLFFFLCFVFGFLIYASLFAAVGSMCSTEEEALQLQGTIIWLVILPLALIMPVMRNPESTFAVIASLFPFFSPILMFARVGSGVAPVWQAGLSILLMAGTLILVATLAGKIYRTGILMQGKRPTLPEIWRWLRAG